MKAKPLAVLTVVMVVALAMPCVQSGAAPVTGSAPVALAAPAAFWFDHTYLCEPGDEASQAGLAGIPDLHRTGVICGSKSYYLPPLAISAPAAVRLTEFAADALSDGTIRVRWTTATELGTIGFTLYRTEGQAGPPWDNPIDQEPARGTGVTGWSYVFSDNTVKLGTTYYYLLEELTTDESRGVYGPVHATAGQMATTRLYLMLVNCSKTGY